MMAASVNPDPHAESFAPQPIHNVTAEFDNPRDVETAVRALNEARLTDQQISVFAGPDGLANLDLHGEGHGVLARLIRAVESATSDENQIAEKALQEGRILVRVSTDGSDEQKATVENLLQSHGAHGIRFFGRLTVERV
jgi:hypothetical protein